MHESRVTPKAINRSKITLDLTRFQTLPPKAPGARPTPKIPPMPKPHPPRPLPKPKPVSRPLPAMRPSHPQALKPAHSQTKKAKQPRNSDRKNPTIADANITRLKDEAKAGKKVIVIKMTPKHKKKKKRIEKKKIIRKAPREKQKILQPPAPPLRTAKATTRNKIPRRKKMPRRTSRPTPRGPDGRLISRLYGNSYSRMSSAQRRFIDENLRQIIRISQRTLNYLGYPREAARFGEQGTNVVEFWLHPNGDISGLRLRRRLRSSALNRQTLEVIRTAYMHYPRPRVKTKIIIYVRYRLY